MLWTGGRDRLSAIHYDAVGLRTVRVTKRKIVHSVAGGGLLLAMLPLSAQKQVHAGALTVERPTLVSLGFEWRVTGDENLHSRVAVRYRKRGETAWHEALPMLRLHGELVEGEVYADRPGQETMTPERKADFDAAQASVNYRSPNMFAGSVLNLEPNTEYECRFTMTDPDGIVGIAQRTVMVRTRKEPEAAAGGRVFHVYPVDWKGPKQEPWFTGLMAAYYLRAPHIDWENAYAPRVRPGDIILMHAGVYLGDRKHYMVAPPDAEHLSLGNMFDGTYYLTASGTAEKPIAIKSAGDGEVIFDGDGAQNLFNLMGGSYNYFEGITVRNTNVAFLLGIKNIAGSSGFTLKHSRVYDVGRVVQDDWSGSKDFYIADNIFAGRHDPEKMMSWTGATWSSVPGYPESMASEYAVKIYGQGHVVAYNYVANWHDGIDIATYGVPDGTPNELADRVPSSIDFYGNDFYNMGDNCMESDGGAHNIRLFANRCFNSAGGALSAQPMWGGPLYLYRNVIYNTPTNGSCKFYPASGVLTYQNTFIGECHAGPAADMEFKNNLMLAQGARSNRSGAKYESVLAVTLGGGKTVSDYNGFRVLPGAATAFEWNLPGAPEKFATFAEYQKATGQDGHSVAIDFDVFRNASVPDANDPQRLYRPEDMDLRLRAGSAASGKGTVLSNITDGFIGSAPDLGAYEGDAPLPHYGPRSPVPGTMPEDKAKLRSWNGPETEQ